MASKTGSVAPKERINIRYVPATGDEQQEVELPLKMLVLGDFKGHADETPVEDRVAVQINKDTFSDVMAEAGLSLKVDVPATLEDGNESDTLSVDLRFKNIKDFSPDSIARQVPELKRLLELREALVALKGPMGNVPAFRKQIQALLGDDSARGKLAKELDQLLSSPEA
jgi:type VI secretion system protein ImpB